MPTLVLLPPPPPLDAHFKPKVPRGVSAASVDYFDSSNVSFMFLFTCTSLRALLLKWTDHCVGHFKGHEINSEPRVFRKLSHFSLIPIITLAGDQVVSETEKTAGRRFKEKVNLRQ